MSPRPNHLPAWQDFSDIVELADSELVGARFQFTYSCRGALKQHVASYDGNALLTGCTWGNREHTVVAVAIDIKRINMRPGCSDPIHVVREFWIPDSSFPDGFRNKVVKEDLWPEENAPTTYSTVVINALRGLSAYDLYVQQGGNLSLQDWLAQGGYTQEVMQTINTLVTNLRETLGLDIAQAIQAAHQAMVDEADRAAGQAQSAAQSAQASAQSAQQAADSVQQAADLATVQATAQAQAAAQSAQASAQSAQDAADSVQQAADLATVQATAQAQAAAQSAQTATAEAEAAHAQAEASQQAADAAAADLAEARAKVAQILAAITGLDPSQSPYDAIVAEAAARAAADATMQTTLDELGLEMQEIRPEVNASWDQEDCTLGGYVVYNTGNVKSDSGYSRTDFLEIPFGAKNYSYTTSWTGSTNGLAFYNDRQEYISGLKAQNKTLTGTLPTGAKYVRFTLKGSNTTSLSVTGGGIEVFKKELKDEIVNEVGRDYKIVYDDSDAIYNGYVDYRNGNVTAGSGFKNTDFIEIFGDSIIVDTNANANTAGVCFYDENKTFVSGFALGVFEDKNYFIPSAAKYLRFSSKSNTTTKVTFSASGGEGLNKTIDFLVNNVTEKPKEIRHVLMFGNSFTGNAVANIASIAANCGLDSASSLQTCIMGGSSLEYWATQTDTSNAPKSTVFGSGLATAANMDTLLSQPWDIIVFQQVSDYSGTYSAYMPHLAILIHRAKTLCSNKNVKIAFHMTWEAKYQTYSSIVATMKSLKEDFGHIVDIIIPSGTAIENIRQTSLSEDNNSFSYNTPIWHLSPGVGEYVAGCCLFQSLFGDMIDGNIYDDTTSVAKTSSVGSVAVDDNNRTLCQKAAMYACISPFQTVAIEDI